jgi:two-component system sensor kinase FixL
MAVNAGERPPMVLLDPLQIEVVVANLIANALDSLAAPSRPGRIDVTIEASRDAVTVSVRDDGAGIAAADAERVFDPLVTTKATGMGMGLTISRAIVEAHGGRMWIEPGPGGKLHFTLPRDRASYG